MSFYKRLFFLLPFIFSSLFWIFSLFKSILYDKFIFKYIHYEKKIFKRLYYLLSFIWISAFMNIYFKDLIQFSSEYNINSKYFVIGILISLILAVLFWDFFFISCKSIKSLSFKDFEFTTEKAKEIVEKNVLTKNRDINFLQNIITTENSLLINMDNYINELDEFSQQMYIKLIKKYIALRNNKKITFFRLEYYFLNEIGFKKIKDEYNLSKHDLALLREKFNQEISSVYIIDSKYKLIKINTLFIENDIIFKIKDTYNLEDEHQIIQNIISHLDNKIINLDREISG